MAEAGFVGADPDVMRGVGREFTNAGGDLRNLIARLNTQVQNISWTGGAASHFKGEWETSYVTKLNALADLLEQTGPKVIEKANEIDSVLNP